MKLSKIYTNKNDKFEPVYFNKGLNVVVAEIKLPENKNKDVHNIGKTTLGRIIDFSLLLGRSSSFFLFKHKDIFADFVFYLELRLSETSFITIKRGVSGASKVSFLSHVEKHQDLSTLPRDSWDHSMVPFIRAKEILDGILDLKAIESWQFRKGIGNLLRTQDDYSDVFKLQKYQSKHVAWKPYIAHVLGFDGELIRRQYSKEDELTKENINKKNLQKEVGNELNQPSTVEGMLLIKKREVQLKEELLEAFDFRTTDFEKIKELVNNIEDKISELNNNRYYLNQNLKKINDSIKNDKILFNPNDAEKLFSEVGILFPKQIKKDFKQLISFNKAITKERSLYLREEKIEVGTTLNKISSELNILGLKRSKILLFLSDADVFEKYKTISNELVELKTDIEILKRRKELVTKLEDSKKLIKKITEELNVINSQIIDNIKEVNSNSLGVFTQIRLNFDEIVNKVISTNALLSVDINSNNHIEFSAELVDSNGKITSAGDGYSYKKLMCIAYDLAILKAHSEKSFPRFVFHDGIFESLDDRKKKNMLAVIREYVEYGIQSIITLIDSDYPSNAKEEDMFNEGEIVLRLNDLGEEGRLFKVQKF